MGLELEARLGGFGFYEVGDIVAGEGFSEEEFGHAGDAPTVSVISRESSAREMALPVALAWLSHST